MLTNYSYGQVSVVTKDTLTVLYHGPRGLTPDENKAVRFKTVTHAIRAARKYYSRRLGRDLISWQAVERDVIV